MITSLPYNWTTKADQQKDCSLGNILFVIAGIIGVATKNNYKWGFQKWINQCYFKNPLPELPSMKLAPFQLQKNYQGFDVGFQGFNIPDNRIIDGYFGSLKYWQHCDSLVRHYLEMKPIAEPYEDCTLVHFRNNTSEAWNKLDGDYYHAALEHFPDKQIVVVTDNKEVAKKSTGLKAEYVSYSPIIDFYLLSHSPYLIGSNSSFTFMAAYLGQPKIFTLPKKWYAGSFWDCPSEENYLPGCIRV